MDDRIFKLISIRETHCTLRKQPVKYTQLFHQALGWYNLLAARPDRNDPPIKNLLDRLYTVLKFIGTPNSLDRKEEFLLNDWPPLFTDLGAISP